VGVLALPNADCQLPIYVVNADYQLLVTINRIRKLKAFENRKLAIGNRK